tara:strand:+ start:364 stop:738 length:375 start_codon:yes stop_codon:yes gene_type:complete
MELFMKYFSIDYRSPPSGMGQIVDTTQPEKILRPNGQECYNYILVDHGTSDSFHWDYSYIGTKFFETPDRHLTLEVFQQIFQFLLDSKVTHVYDGELSYDYDGADEDGFFTLNRWAEIMRGFLK